MRYGIFLFFILFFPFGFSQASTLVNQNISEDTTWTKGAGPYVISGYVDVQSGKTLTIEPGTIVKFANKSKLNVLGILKAEGSDLEKIYITSLLNDEVGGDTNGDGSSTTVPQYDGWNSVDHWSLVVNKGSGTSTFSNIETSYSYESLLIISTPFEIKNVNVARGVGFDIRGSKGIILNLAGNDLKRELVATYDKSDLTIDNVAIDKTLNDALGFYDSKVVLRNVTGKNIGTNFVFTGGSNVYIDKISADNLNYYGLYFYKSDVYVSNANLKGVSDYNVLNGHASNITLASSTISGSGFDVFDFYDDYYNNNIFNLSVIDSIIENAGYDAIFLAKNTISHIIGSTIRNSGYGINSYKGVVDFYNNSIYGNTNCGFCNWGTTTVSVANNWWGNASGPSISLDHYDSGKDIFGPADFTPWLTEPPVEKRDLPTCCSNVVFIPGIQASRLYKKGLFFENQLWEPNRNADVEKLYLDENGNSLDPDIYTRDILKRTNIGLGVYDVNVYKSFSETMDNLVNEKKINAWEALPYDWRLDLNKIVSDGVKLENGKTLNFIDEIIKTASSSKTGKVTIVTHSNGGLVAKVLINELKKRGKESLVDNLVMVAAPELGTPKAIAGILHGYDQELGKGLLVNASVARTMGENMMGAYNLLPQESYFKNVTSPVVEFDPSVDKIRKNLRSYYGDSINSIDRLRDFLLGAEGRIEPKNSDVLEQNVLKSNLLGLAQVNHSGLDSWVPSSNIKLTQLAGWGVKTLSGIKYVSRIKCSNVTGICFPYLDEEPLMTEDGDGTVVSPSAVSAEGEKYYLDLEKNNYAYKDNTIIHNNIFEATSTLEFIKNIVVEEKNDTSKYISTDKPFSQNKTLELALHSPVSIEVFDASGQHTGVAEKQINGSDMRVIENNIPGSKYLEFGEGKYVFLDGNESYFVVMNGLDFGTFSLDIKYSENGENVLNYQFTDIPTSPTEKVSLLVEISTTSTFKPVLKIDYNGDGINDVYLKPGQNFNPRDFVKTFKGSYSSRRLNVSLEEFLIEENNKVLIEKIERFINEHKNSTIGTKDLDAITKLIKTLIEKLKEYKA